MIETIRKRDGKLVPYDNYKIANAVFKAAEAVGGKDFGMALSLGKAGRGRHRAEIHPKSIPAVKRYRPRPKKY